MATNALITGAPSSAPGTFTPSQRETLDALGRRLDHTAAIARLLATHSSAEADWADAIRGIAETLDDQAARLDAILLGEKA